MLKISPVAVGWPKVIGQLAAPLPYSLVSQVVKNPLTSKVHKPKGNAQAMFLKYCNNADSYWHRLLLSRTTSALVQEKGGLYKNLFNGGLFVVVVVLFCRKEIYTQRSPPRGE